MPEQFSRLFLNQVRLLTLSLFDITRALYKIDRKKHHQPNGRFNPRIPQVLAVKSKIMANQPPFSSAHRARAHAVCRQNFGHSFCWFPACYNGFMPEGPILAFTHVWSHQATDFIRGVHPCEITHKVVRFLFGGTELAKR